jgi:hypothetical protein
MPAPPPSIVICEACHRHPVVEPDYYTKCPRCLTRPAQGKGVSGCRNAALLCSKRRGRRGRSIQTSNLPKEE